MNTEPFLPFMIRAILGILFFFQAYDIIFRIGIKHSCDTICNECRAKNIPDWFSRMSLILSTYIELIGGFLLILGLLKSYILVVLGLNLIMVTLGFSYLRGLWDMNHVFPRLVLLIVLFVIPTEWDIWTLDFYFR